MSKLVSNLAAKITAIALIIIFGVGMSVTLVITVFSLEQGFFDYKVKSFYDTQICKDLVFDDYTNVTNYFDQLLSLTIKEEGYIDKDYSTTFYDESSGKWYTDQNIHKYSEMVESIFDKTEQGKFDSINNVENSYLNFYKKQLANKNFKYEVKTTSGKLLFGNYEGDRYGYSASYNYTFAGNGYTDNASVVMNCYVNEPFAYEDSYSYYAGFCNFANNNKVAIIVILGICSIVCLMLFLFLCAAVGHRRGVEGVVPNFQDKIPFDLYLLMAVITFVLLLVIDANIFGSSYSVRQYVVAMASLIGAGIVLLSTGLTFATRVKMGKWWRNTITYKLFKITVNLFQKISVVWKGAFATIGIIFAEFIFGILFASGAEIITAFMWLIFHGVLFFAAVHVLFNLRKLKRSGEMIAAGNIDYKTDTASMFGDFKKHAENLNSIAVGMTAAVDERLKSERFKTELITNVSHDIKTPLTSIINYVDLLKKENIEDEKMKGYLEVLERQSARLKKLIEDLVEASKASTGNIKANLVKTHVSEILGQSVAEYSERFQKANLEAVVNCDDNLHIWADGKLLWRVLDNLLGNICKYAQSGTRVYFDAEYAEGNRIAIKIKNISCEKLNMDPNELLGRFVRGDSSRSTEGSGLGLSIARSLTEIQRGIFKIDIDGDLFKITVSFFAAENSQTL